MSWIKTIPYDQTEGKLRKLYDRVKGPNNNVDNIMMAHSLRPHSMEGHMALYKNVLHHTANTVPKWFLETIGVWVSHLNECGYCVEHHFAGLKRLMSDDARADAIFAALTQGAPDTAPLDKAQKLALEYARKLTICAHDLTEQDAIDLRGGGYSDGEILEINQVAAYFNYANRTALGLGCSTSGDVLGLSPGKSDDPGNWSHQ